mgnify:CR=1 FL=1
MKKTLLIALSLALVLALALPALAAEVTVTGTATVSLPADTASLQVGATIKANTAAEAQAQVDQVMRDILAALDKLGIDKADIKTSNYSVYVEMPYEEYGAIRPSAPVYNASNMLSVTIRNLEQVAAVIDAATTAGANQIYSLSFTASQSADAYNKALERAVEDGQMKAKVLAQAAGKQLGALEDMKAEQIFGDVYGIMNRMDFGMAASEKATIVTGDVSVSASVTLTYELE